MDWVCLSADARTFVLGWVRHPDALLLTTPWLAACCYSKGSSHQSQTLGRMCMYASSQAAKIAEALTRDVHYNVDEKQKSVLLTEDG